jgi:hypothetical protein
VRLSLHDGENGRANHRWHSTTLALVREMVARLAKGSTSGVGYVHTASWTEAAGEFTAWEER